MGSGCFNLILFSKNHWRKTKICTDFRAYVLLLFPELYWNFPPFLMKCFDFDLRECLPYSQMDYLSSVIEVSAARLMQDDSKQTIWKLYKEKWEKNKKDDSCRGDFSIFSPGLEIFRDSRLKRSTLLSSARCVSWILDERLFFYSCPFSTARNSPAL